MADISAARLNNLQSRLALILGNGSGQSGYGQSLLSSPVSNIDGSLVSADDINAMYADMVKARIHQIGTEPTQIAEIISNLNIIAEDTSFSIGDDGITVIDPNGTKKGIIDYENLMTQVEIDKFLAHSSQVALESGTTSQRTAQWNGLVYLELTVNFTNADHRRHFFNTGGSIRISGNNSGAIGDKGKDWNLLMIEIGSVTFNYSATFPTSSGIGSAIGNYNLTNTYQTIFTKVGGGTYSGVYAGNIFTIKAREASSNSIQFRVELNDVSTDPPVDNNVDGRLICSFQHVRANSAAVSVNPPTYTINVAL
jgi:hypothetical protein